MALLISTNMYRAEEFDRVLPHLERYGGRLGVEVFPMFHREGYEELLDRCLERLRNVPISFHGPYYGAEHSAGPGTHEYGCTMSMVEQTLRFSRALNSRYVVFHHNNRRAVDGEREKMLETSCSNFREIESMFAPYGIPLVVENAGVADRGTMLLDQQDFVALCKRENYRVLIDIGHANANGWDLPRVMGELKSQIAAYHLHNNDGCHDSHRRIGDGTLDLDKFLADFDVYTPLADWVLEYSEEVAGDEEGIRVDIERLLNCL